MLESAHELSPKNADLSLDRYRSYLLFLARLQLDSRARANLIPRTSCSKRCWRRTSRRTNFTATTKPWAAWLRRALANNLRDALRAFRRDKRDIARERSLEAGIEASSVGLARWLGADPIVAQSHRVRATKTCCEWPTRSCSCRKPSAKRSSCIICRDGALSEVAGQLQRSEPAVAGLLHRGLKQLRKLMQTSE